MSNQNDWSKFTGEYEKIPYDIKLHTGEIVLDCYPNAGTFREFSTGRRFQGNEVAEIKIFGWDEHYKKMDKTYGQLKTKSEAHEKVK